MGAPTKNVADTNGIKIKADYTLASANNGGSAVISYNIWWDKGTNTWESIKGENPLNVETSH